MKKKRLAKSLRKYIRQEKARIRREVLDLSQRKKMIAELNQKFFKKYQDLNITKNEDRRNI